MLNRVCNHMHLFISDLPINSYLNPFRNQEVFIKKVEISVRKDKVIEVTISEGWYSEHEMSQDLKWSAWDAYYLDLYTGFIVSNGWQWNPCMHVVN